MSVYVFTGPTLSAADARCELDATYLPPVAQGDVVRVMLRRPSAIGIVDGYFDAVPAVWHKELLWAMSQGVHVFGSASMGALRAAELHSFGMIGVGKIFDAYMNGTLEDDDEVAVAHASGEFGFRVASEAMVNIRYTLQAAEAHSVISSDARKMIEDIAKKLFYPDRLYSTVLEQARVCGVPQEEVTALQLWITTGSINQKREDALCMLREMRRLLSTGMSPKETKFDFQYTAMWEVAFRTAGNIRVDQAGAPEMEMASTILDELRLVGNKYCRARRIALARCLALLESRRVRMPDGQKGHGNSVEPTYGSGWLAENDLSEYQVQELIDQERRLAWVETQVGFAIEPHILDHLRVSGQYGRLRTRAVDKSRRLNELGLDKPDIKDIGVSEDQLWCWYFKEMLRKPVVPDIGAYSKSLQFRDVSAFRRAVMREYVYMRSRLNSPGANSGLTGATSQHPR
jgi:hypothetical protein